MKNGRYCGPSSSLGQSRPPHFSRRQRNSSNLPPQTQVSVSRPNPAYQPIIRNSFHADEAAKSHVPTAEKVSRVFSNTHPHLFDNSLFQVEEGTEEVNFEDLALIHERVLNSATVPAVQGEVCAAIIQEPAPELKVRPEATSGATLMTTRTIVRAEPEVTTTTDVELPDEPAIEATVEAAQLIISVQKPMVVETQSSTTRAEPGQATTPTESPPLFIIDTNPSTSQKQINVPAYDIRPHAAFLGESVNAGPKVEPDPEDDVIVYEAPNPRISTPRVGLATLTNIPIPNHTPSSTPRQINPLWKSKFAHVVGKNARRGSSGIPGVKRKRLAEHGNFASFGAMIAEARIRSQGDRRDPKEHLRRQGDSDLDWGDETDKDEGGPIVATAEGMDLDPDLVGWGVTMAAMERFVKGVDANHVTMDDLEDTNIEEDSPSDDETDEDEYVTDDDHAESDEEMMLVEESLATQDVSDFSDDEDGELEPRAGFQARLDRLRKEQRKLIRMEGGPTEDEDEIDQDFKWDEGDEINVCITCPLGLYDSHGTPRIWSKSHSVNTRRTGWRVMRSLGPSRMAFSRSRSPRPLRQVSPSVALISSSRIDDFVERKDLPAELREQWEKDRVKKAKQKNEREIARLEAVLNPLVTKKGGKKSKKAMIAVARLDPSIEIPHRIVDMVSIEQLIRRFLADRNKDNMALPACDKSTRKKIHNLATLFGLNSKSKGGGLGRYTTLIKTKRTGKNIDEQKVGRMMRGFKYRASYDVSDDDWGGGRKGKGKGKGKGKFKKEKDQSGHLATREGEVVGHVRAWCFIESDSLGSLLTNGLFHQAAPKIDETNVGFMMLAAMGWSDGATIGLSGGLDGPITAVIKKTKLGLGAGVSTKS